MRDYRIGTAEPQLNFSLVGGVRLSRLRNLVFGRIDRIRQQERKRVTKPPRPGRLVVTAVLFLHPHQIFAKRVALGFEYVAQV